MRSPFLLTLALPLALSLLPRPAQAETCGCPFSNVINVGHRGTGSTSSSNPFPESTLVSFEQGLKEGAQWLELDVHLSADGELVVIHDDTVDRTTDGTGCVGSLSLDALRALDAGKGSPLAGTGIKIPTLAEIFDTFDAPLNIEVKMEDANKCAEPDRATLAAKLTAAIAADPKKRAVLVTSFDDKMLDAMHAASPSQPLALLSIAMPDISKGKERGWVAVQLQGTFIGEDEVRIAREAGLELHAWTVNAPDRIRALIELGVQRIITDDPDKVAEVLSALCADAPVCESNTSSKDGCAASPRPQQMRFGALGAALSLLGLSLVRKSRRRALGRFSFYGSAAWQVSPASPWQKTGRSRCSCCLMAALQRFSPQWSPRSPPAATTMLLRSTTKLAHFTRESGARP